MPVRRISASLGYRTDRTTGIDQPADEARAHETCRRIAGKFGTFECDDCAAEILKALGRDSEARAVRIRPADGTEVICLAETEAQISLNRSHVGVHVGDLIFDNLHHGGVPAGECPGRYITQTGAPLNLERRPIGDFYGRIFLRERFRDWVYGD